MIDLRSDTLTLPTADELDSVMTAQLGDDRRREHNGGDPTVKQLEREVAAITGHEAALFCPSGTLGNLTALMTWCSRGDTVLVEKDMHMLVSEKALFSPAFMGLKAESCDGTEPGRVDAQHWKNGLTKQVKLACLENTHNFSGARVKDPNTMKQLCEAAHAAGVPVHLDGARIYNAAAASNCSVSDLTKHVDSVMLCLSKGIGAPGGSVVCGKKEWIERAREVRNALGGGLRQAGILAAPALVALAKAMEQVREDHQKACCFAEKLISYNGPLRIVELPESNMVLLDPRPLGMSPEEVCDVLYDLGVWVRPITGGLIRAVFYRGITKTQAEEAAEVCAELKGA